MACTNVCTNCYYHEMKESGPTAGHCYMFFQEPDGECKQFRMSQTAKDRINDVMQTFDDSWADD